MTAEVSQWIDPFGAVTTLDVDWEASGRFMPPTKIVTTGVPGQSGSRLREVRHGERQFKVRVILSSATEPLLRTAQRAMATSMNALNGEGIYRVQSPLGDVREIKCLLAAGFEVEEKPGESGPTMQKADLVFQAGDPYWRASSDTSQTFTIGVTPTFFPIFPIRLTSSQIAVDTSVLNDGDVESWPVWQIAGPGSAITLRNLTTGKQLSLPTGALVAGQSLTIDTTPGVKSIRTDDGVSAWSVLDLSVSSLWSLAVGSNSIRLEMGGAIAGSSSLQLNFRKRYLTP